MSTGSFTKLIALKLIALIATTSVMALGFGGCSARQAPTKEAVGPEEVVAQYADLAHAIYSDALGGARRLQQQVDAFIDRPTEARLQAARESWRAARVPYMQSEVFRFGNPVVDAWETQVNAWPLDEGLIDYVDSDFYEHVLGNPGATANIIASESLPLGSTRISTARISPRLIARLNEFGGSEANVASGYHAIEFLLWGQDFNGTAAGAGQRPASDYAVGAGCTHGHCARRARYLSAATALLVDDLEAMVNQWRPGGAYRTRLLAEEATQGLRRMLFGMGSLSLGELAGERMKVALEAGSVEDEHDCFSDNTHNSHFHNARGIQNIYLGRYQRVDGSIVQGPSLSDLVAAANPGLDQSLRESLAATLKAIGRMVERAEDPQAPMTFDMMIAEGNEEGQALITASIEALVQQTRLIEKAARALGIRNLNPETADHRF